MSKNIGCSACKFYAAGGKSRIAMKHTCGKEPSVKRRMAIPRVDPEKAYDIFIYRTGMIETKNALLVRCKKQEIEGITIPRGYEIWVPSAGETSVRNGFSSNPYIHIAGWKINEVLRTLYIDQLRNG